jgi:hypothetical protein
VLETFLCGIVVEIFVRADPKAVTQALGVVVPDRDITRRVPVAAGHDVIAVAEEGLSDEGVRRVELRSAGEVMPHVDLHVAA